MRDAAAAARGIVLLQFEDVSPGMVSDSCQSSKIHFINMVFSISLKQTDLEDERRKLQQQILSEKDQYDQKVAGLESQIAALKTAWEFDKAATQQKIVSTETVRWPLRVFTK